MAASLRVSNVAYHHELLMYSNFSETGTYYAEYCVGAGAGGNGGKGGKIDQQSETSQTGDHNSGETALPVLSADGSATFV